jgi:hypothetical protein
VTVVIALASKIIDGVSMTRPIRELTRCAAILAISAAALPLATATASAAPASTNGATTVPLRSILRSCDFSPLQGAGGQNRAAATSAIRAAGGTVTAEVRLSEPSSPGTHFDVRLIQAPRASNSPCGSAGPGVAVGSLDTDGVGQASTTLQDGIQSGTTSAWVFIQRPSPYSQTPEEFYTSDFLAPV